MDLRTLASAGHPRDISELSLPDALRILMLAPHPDDFDAVGVTLKYSLFTQAAQRSGQPLAAFLDRDPKTIGMRTDLYMPFGQEEGDWKAALLRFHDSQHQRNLHTRGHGFDDRILDVNRAIAHELSLTHQYAEAFEIELHNIAET